VGNQLLLGMLGLRLWGLIAGYLVGVAAGYVKEVVGSRRSLEVQCDDVMLTTLQVSAAGI
jgi:hypothetical protein